LNFHIQTKYELFVFLKMKELLSHAALRQIKNMNFLANFWHGRLFLFSMQFINVNFDQTLLNNPWLSLFCFFPAVIFADEFCRSGNVMVIFSL
jgi:hypothetical protein